VLKVKPKSVNHVLTKLAEEGFNIKEKKWINHYWSKSYYRLSEKGERFLAYLEAKKVV
jgi:DNA-binding PadR family transcriptional regulator